jgi:hypothetical protein
MPRRWPNRGDRQAKPQVSAGVTNRIRLFRFGCSPRLPVEIRLMRETKSRRSLRPIDISYRNDLKKWVGIKCRSKRENNCRLGSGSMAQRTCPLSTREVICGMLLRQKPRESSAGCLLNTGSFACRKLLIEFQVEFKYIDSRFAKNSELPSLRVFG